MLQSMFHLRPPHEDIKEWSVSKCVNRDTWQSEIKLRKLSCSRTFQKPLHWRCVYKRARWNSQWGCVKENAFLPCLFNPRTFGLSEENGVQFLNPKDIVIQSKGFQWFSSSRWPMYGRLYVTRITLQDFVLRADADHISGVLNLCGIVQGVFF